MHSLVLELTGKKEPSDGLQGKFSVYHGCAAGLIYGRAGEEEFADAVVNDPRVVALRDKVQATVDDTIARGRRRCHGGARRRTARARAGRPRDRLAAEAAVRRAARSQVRRTGRAAARRDEGRAQITAACWRLASLADVRELTALCRP